MKYILKTNDNFYICCDECRFGIPKKTSIKEDAILFSYEEAINFINKSFLNLEMIKL